MRLSAVVPIFFAVIFVSALDVVTSARAQGPDDTQPSLPQPSPPPAEPLPSLQLTVEPPAQPTSQTGSTLPKGSTAFCLYELPGEDGKRRWINLGIVQYVEYSRNELKLYYGGGNLGSGHEARLPVPSPDKIEETLNKVRQAAATCR